MTTTFKKISGGKYDFIKDQEVINRIEEAGRKKVVFVEGETDERVFFILFDDFENRISFIPVGSHHKVKEYLQHTINRGIRGLVGIVDRDFMSDEDRNKMVEDYKNLLHIHGRFTLENYLIESGCLLEFIKDNCTSAKIKEEDVQQIIEEILKKLLVVMAGNITLLSYSVDKLNMNVSLQEDIVLLGVTNKILENNDRTATKISIKDEYIANLNKISGINTLEELHKKVNGKYFLYNFKREIKERYKITIHDNSTTIYHLARILKGQYETSRNLSSLHDFLKTASGEAS